MNAEGKLEVHNEEHGLKELWVSKLYRSFSNCSRTCEETLLLSSKVALILVDVLLLFKEVFLSLHTNDKLEKYSNYLIL